MRTAIGFGFVLLLCAHPADAQPPVTPLKSCPLLTSAEAAAVLGSGTAFLSGFQAPRGSNVTIRCEFEQGDGNRRLTVDTWKTIGGKDAWEATRKLSNGKMEPGMGDYAYSCLEDGAPFFLVVKGVQTLQLRVGGKGGTSVDSSKVREAAKKAVPRF